MKDTHGAAPDNADVRAILNDVAASVRLKWSGVLGPGDSYSHLKRQPRRESDSSCTQANPKHIDQVIELLGLSRCEGATTPPTADYP
eukprot:4775400-Alexandrium_andersonii.AAC.1